MRIPHNIVDDEVRTVPGLVHVVFEEGTSGESARQALEGLGGQPGEGWTERGGLHFDVRVPIGEEGRHASLFGGIDGVVEAGIYEKKGGRLGRCPPFERHR